MTVPPMNRSWSPGYLVQWFFDQSEFWITAKGDKVLVHKMNDGHAINTLLMLERVAGDIEPLLKAEHIQDTPLYEALHRKVMAAVGEAMPPLSEPEIEDWDTHIPEQPLRGGLEYLVGQVLKPVVPPEKAAFDIVDPLEGGSRVNRWVFARDLIETLVRDAATHEYDIVVDYVDRNGNATENRRVRPTEVRTLQSISKPFPELRIMLLDRDDDDESKMFYLSRIQRARRA